MTKRFFHSFSIRFFRREVPFTCWGWASVFLVAPILLASCGLEQTSQSGRTTLNSTTTQTGSSASQSTASQTVPIGVWGNVKDNRAVQVTGSEIDTSITATGILTTQAVESKGGKLVVVFVTLKNIGSESGDLTWSDFQLVDGQGRKYDDLEDGEDLFVFWAWLKERKLGESSDQLFPGATVETAKAYRVAPDASNLKLEVNHTLFEIQKEASRPTTTTVEARQPELVESNAPAKTASQPTRAVSSPVVRASPAADQNDSYVVQAQDGTANLRSRPSTQVGVVAKISNGTVVRKLSEQTNSSGQLWYEVEVNGKVGWLYSELLKESDQDNNAPQNENVADRQEYQGTASTGEKVYLDLNSIQADPTKQGYSFTYQIGQDRPLALTRCDGQFQVVGTAEPMMEPQSEATRKMLRRVCTYHLRQ